MRTGDTFPVKTNPEGKPAPAAVPIVSPEEAEKLNAEAIEYGIAEQERREPFLGFYKNVKIESIEFEGTVRAISTIPDPEKNDYDNCLYALFVEIDSIFSAVAPDVKYSREVLVYVPIMKDKTILQDNKFLPGDKVWGICSEYDTMPQAIQEIQLSDDIQSYEYQQYYPLEIKKITAFQTGGTRNFSKREIEILPIQRLPKDEKAVTLRNDRIRNEIARIEEELKKHGGSFEKWKEEYKPVTEKYKKLCEDEYKGWINDSFFAVGHEKPEPTYKTQEYLNGILPYKEYLEKNNIDLIVVRIPQKDEFACSVLASDSFQESPAWVEHHYECLKNDIEIIDPLPEMWKHRFDFPLFYFYNEPQEFHPFEGQAFISAKVLSEVLKRYSYPTSEQPIELEDICFRTTQPRYYWPTGNQKFNPTENIIFKRVIRGKQSLGTLSVSTGSPFIFLSNSFFAYPRRELGASLPAYTAFFIQHVPDWFYQSGVGNPMIRNLITDQQALSNRKAVIMVGHPGNWNGSFPAFPLYLFRDTKRITLELSLDFLSSEIKRIDDQGLIFTKDENGIIHLTQNSEKKNSVSNCLFLIPKKKTHACCESIMVFVPLVLQ